MAIYLGCETDRLSDMLIISGCLILVINITYVYQIYMFKYKREGYRYRSGRLLHRAQCVYRIRAGVTDVDLELYEKNMLIRDRNEDVYVHKYKDVRIHQESDYKIRFAILHKGEFRLVFSNEYDADTAMKVLSECGAKVIPS